MKHTFGCELVKSTGKHLPLSVKILGRSRARAYKAERSAAMMLVPTCVAPSSIEGVGIFAAADIPAGTEIWRFDPAFERIYTPDELSKLGSVQRNYIDRYGYSQMEDRTLTIVETDNGRFMNHFEQ